jgi:hypothetical protein
MNTFSAARPRHSVFPPDLRHYFRGEVTALSNYACFCFCATESLLRLVHLMRYPHYHLEVGVRHEAVQRFGRSPALAASWSSGCLPFSVCRVYAFVISHIYGRVRSFNDCGKVREFSIIRGNTEMRTLKRLMPLLIILQVLDLLKIVCSRVPQYLLCNKPVTPSSLR